jgi:deoxyhypusine synthase
MESSPLKDFRWHKGITASELLEGMGSLGYQASELKRAAEIILSMKRENAKIFLSFTSNMTSSGLRGLFAQMIEKGFADVLVTTVGSIEEDFIKSEGGNFLLGSYDEDDKDLCSRGMNRIGNILVPSESYEAFEKNLVPALEEIIKPGSAITPSELIRELGKRCGDENSILGQAYKKGVPIYCPALTDGSFGFQLQELRNRRDFQIDIVKDMKNIALEASPQERIGIISLGGGVAKHHALLANLTNGGADYAVYISTASAYSGSLSGASAEEARSWGKVKESGDAATVHGEATLLLPLLMSYVFERSG